MGNDIQANSPLTAGQKNVGAAEFNALVNEATLKPTVITARSAAATPSGTVQLLIEDSGVLKRATLNALSLENNGLVNGRTLATPDGSDALMIYDESAGALRKCTIDDIFQNVTNELINTKTAEASPASDDEFLIWDVSTSTAKKVTRANIFSGWEGLVDFSDLPSFAAPAPSDFLPIYDALAGANKKASFETILFTSAAVLNLGTDLQDADLISLYDNSGAQGSKTSLGSLREHIMPAGTVLQVLQAVKTEKEIIASGAAWAGISNLVQAITPASSSNKILIRVTIAGGTTSAAQFRVATGGASPGSEIEAGDADGAKPSLTLAMATGLEAGGGSSNIARTISFEYLHSPGTDAEITYRVEVFPSAQVNINSSVGDANSSAAGRYISTLTLMEIKG